MPRLPGWAWLLLAIGFATLASYMALGWLKRQAAVQPSVKEKIYVVRASAKAEKDRPLAEAQPQRVAWDKDYPPEDFFSDLKQVVGRETAKSLTSGDLITRENTREKRTGITAELSPNQRAMTVKVDEASGVAGFLTPGNRVDVVVVVDKGEFDKDPLAKLLLQNLKVLGTGQNLENRPGDKPQIVPTVTLEVSPEQGESLALAAQEGRISLVLRGKGDQQLVETQGADASKLFGRPKKAISQAPPAAATVAPPARTVEMIRGLELAPVNFR
ncbi:MAG: Flp pilus assembly protein CpaB [Deltaproteobacteria bacterium]|nr:Flp pilus assembly protein CpaB [Deltaproteobacteria bacterium]